MGRPRKEVLSADADSLNYIKHAIAGYKDLKAYCGEMEHKRPTFLHNYGIDPTVFQTEKGAAEEMLMVPDTSACDALEVEQYLEAKEQVYLLEHGIFLLQGKEQELAKLLFLQGKHWSVAAEELYLSKATLFRMRNRILVKLALSVDAFMCWKVRVLFG